MHWQSTRAPLPISPHMIQKLLWEAEIRDLRPFFFFFWESRDLRPETKTNPDRYFNSCTSSLFAKWHVEHWIVWDIFSQILNPFGFTHGDGRAAPNARQFRLHAVRNAAIPSRRRGVGPRSFANSGFAPGASFHITYFFDGKTVGRFHRASFKYNFDGVAEIHSFKSWSQVLKNSSEQNCWQDSHGLLVGSRGDYYLIRLSPTTKVRSMQRS